MSSSSSSGSSRTPSPMGSAPRNNAPLNNFDPFVVHPFTSFAGPSQQTSAPPKHIAGTHTLPHPSMLNIDAHVPPPVHHPAATYGGNSKFNAGQGVGYQTVGVSTSPSGHSAYPQSNMTPSQTFKSIHVPFRQDTSSPDLSEVLRRKRMGL